MSKFNSPNTDTTKTVNLAGGESFKESPKLALISLLLTNFVKDQFYRDQKQSLTDMNTLIDAIPDKRFVGKSAIYARIKFGMRSITHALAAELAVRVKGEKWTKNFFNKIVFRPDDMTEILAYYYKLGHKNEPNALKKGFSKAFTRFDAYQLAKYKKEGQAVSLIDVANVVHPGNTEAIGQLIKGTLPVPKTWETKLSQAGKAESEEEKETQKKEAWKELLTSRKLGYFALLRNLRNIIEQAPDLIPQAIIQLTDEEAIKKSMVLPFRFTTAIEEIGKINGQGVREILGAISLAIDKSTANVPKFDGNTLVVLDGSGSMGGQPMEIGALFASVLYKSNQADFMIFSNDVKYASFNPLDSTVTIGRQMAQLAPGGGTNFHSIFQTANKKYERIIILSDMQGWVGYNAPTGSFSEYKTRLGANPRVYSFDLQGYGTLQFPEANVFTIAGFSEKIFSVMKLLEQDRNALINEIEKIEL